MRLLLFVSLITVLIFAAVACGGSGGPSDPPQSPLQSKIARFAPTEMKCDLSALSEGDRQALGKLAQAAALMDKIYLRQAWDGNEALLARLESDATAEGLERLHYFRINMGPWSELDDNEPFVSGVPARPAGANYYPPDMTADEFNSWFSGLPESEQKKASGFFYTIRRNADGGLETVPYSREYKDLLEPAAGLLREAAAGTDNASLADYLKKRADAFLSNDYYDSDVAWLAVDSPIEVTIGPYEVYMDALFNYKAAFEAYVGLRDNEETQKLATFAGYLQDIENHLPIDPRYRNPKLAALAPIRVIDEAAIGGEAKAGVQTAAFNLPNDERVLREKGAKRVMLKNVQQAKFDKILDPIAGVTLDESQRSLVAFEPFFTHILAHELMHGLGPHQIRVDGRETTVRLAMKDLGSALEEAKADISGLFALQYLIDQGVLDQKMERPMYATYLAGMFRSVRFGVEDAHGKGMALQFNYLWDEKALSYDPAKGTFRVNFDRIPEAVRKLTGDIMTIQAEGSYRRAKELLDRYGVIRPEMKKALDRLSDLPVDIEPHFALEG